MQTASLKQFDADAAETKPLSSIVEASLYVAARPARNQHRFCPAVKLRKSAAKPARRRRRARPGNAPHNSLCGNSTTMYCSAGICVLKKETNGKVRLNDEKKNDCRPDRLRPDRFMLAACSSGEESASSSTSSASSQVSSKPEASEAESSEKPEASKAESSEEPESSEDGGTVSSQAAASSQASTSKAGCLFSGRLCSGCLFSGRRIQTRSAVLRSLFETPAA